MSTEAQNTGPEQEIVDGIDVQQEFDDQQNTAFAEPGAMDAPPVEFDDTSHQDDEDTAALEAAASAPAEDTTQQTQQAEDSVPAEDAAASGDDAGDEPAFDQDLLDAAGITAEQAQSQFGTPEALENAVRLIDQRFFAVGQAALQQQQQPVQTQQPQPTQPQRPDAQPAPPQIPTFELPKPEGAEDWDPDTKALVEAQNKFYHQQFDRLRQEMGVKLGEQAQAVQAMLQERQQVLEHQYVQEFDGFCNDLGDSWKGLLGEGSGYEMPKESLQFQNRAHLDQVAAQLAAGRQAQGQPELPRDVLWKRALNLAFPNQQESAIRQEVTDQVVRRQRLQTNRPSTRKSEPVRPEDKAAATAEEFFKKRGFSVQEDDFDYETV